MGLCGGAIGQAPSFPGQLITKGHISKAILIAEQPWPKAEAWQRTIGKVSTKGCGGQDARDGVLPRKTGEDRMGRHKWCEARLMHREVASRSN